MRIRRLLISSWVFVAGSFAQSAGIPVILNHSETVNFGDVFYLQGSGFGNAPSVQYSFNDSNWANLSTLESGSGVVMAKFPATETRLPDLVTVRVSPDNRTWSQPVYINRARATSLDTNQIGANSKFRIFGRNLYLGRTPVVRFVNEYDGTISFATVDTKNSLSYVLVATAPNNIKPGLTYTVYVDHGFEGNASSGGESLAAQSLPGRQSGSDFWSLGTPWAVDLDDYANVYNIQNDSRLPHHANGKGNQTDVAAISEAIGIASQSGGGIVFLPAGAYNIAFTNGCGLILSNRVALVGAGAGQTQINYGFGAPPTGGGYAVCFGNQAGISDLTLNNVDESGLWPQSGSAQGSSEIFLKRVNWSIGTSQWITLTSVNSMAIEDSTFTQGVDSSFNYNGIFNLTGSSWAEISRNTIQFAVGGMLLDKLTNSVFENNSVIRNATVSIDPMAETTHVIEANFVTNVEFLGNSFATLGGPLPQSNDGEVINSEGGGGYSFDQFRGTVTSSTATKLSDANQNFYLSSNYYPALRPGIAIVAIVSGEGMGQWRNVTAVSSDGTTLTVDRPWDVAPTAGSHYATFDWSAAALIVAANTMTGNNKGIELFNASATDIQIDSNVLSDNSGIMLSPDQEGPALFNFVLGVQITNNVISDNAGLRPAYVAIVPREDAETTSFGTAVLGVEVRSNNLLAHNPNVHVALPNLDNYKAVVEGFNCYWQWQTPWASYDPGNTPAPLLGTIFQSNQAQNSSTVFYLNTGSVDTVIADTIALNSTQFLLDDFIQGADSGSAGTVILDRLAHRLNPSSVATTPRRLQ